ncbi:MAG: hypothetical protein NZQ09_10805 [Chloroflexus sp.]|nr:hypothetical protein [Chloroflexus sp.]
MTTGDPLAFVKVIRAYKLQAYGQEVAYERYLSAFLHIDPYITLLGIGGIIACLKSRKRFLAKLAYVSVTLVPLEIFIGLHGGQLEPPGNYLRYLAPFLFFFYPALSYLLFVSVQVLNIAKLREYVLGGCLAVMITTQLTTTFQFTNDPSAYGLAVGEMIRQLRQANPEIADRPVMIELSYWEYLAIKVGANDIDTIMYDRDLDYRRHTPSLLMTNEQSFQRCLLLHDVSYLIVKDPVLQTAAEKTLGLSPMMMINGYVFYPTDQLARESMSLGESCPLRFNRGN